MILIPAILYIMITMWGWWIMNEGLASWLFYLRIKRGCNEEQANWVDAIKILGFIDICRNWYSGSNPCMGILKITLSPFEFIFSVPSIRRQPVTHESIEYIIKIPKWDILCESDWQKLIAADKNTSNTGCCLYR